MQAAKDVIGLIAIETGRARWNRSGEGINVPPNEIEPQKPEGDENAQGEERPSSPDHREPATRDRCHEKNARHGDPRRDFLCIHAATESVRNRLFGIKGVARV